MNGISKLAEYLIIIYNFIHQVVCALKTCEVKEVYLTAFWISAIQEDDNLHFPVVLFSGEVPQYLFTLLKPEWAPYLWRREIPVPLRNQSLIPQSISTQDRQK